MKLAEVVQKAQSPSKIISARMRPTLATLEIGVMNVGMDQLPSSRHGRGITWGLVQDPCESKRLGLLCRGTVGSDQIESLSQRGIHVRYRP